MRCKGQTVGKTLGNFANKEKKEENLGGPLSRKLKSLDRLHRLCHLLAMPRCVI